MLVSRKHWLRLFQMFFYCVALSLQFFTGRRLSRTQSGRDFSEVPEAMQAAPNPGLNEPPYMKPYLKPSRSDPTLLSSYGDDMVAMSRPLYNHMKPPGMPGAPGLPQMPSPMMPPPPSQAAAAHAAAAAAAAGQSSSKPDSALAK